MPTGNAAPPPDEVVAALAQMALLALGFAVVVVATRSMQVSFDKRSAERARQEAAQASRNRLRTLSERNVFYCCNKSSSDSSNNSASVHPHHLDSAASATTAAAFAAGPAARAPTSALSADDCGSYSSAPTSSDNDTRDWNSGVSRTSTCPTPPAAAAPPTGASGGAGSLLMAASSLLQRRQSALVATPAPAGNDRAAVTSGDSGGFDRSQSLGVGTEPAHGAWFAAAAGATPGGGQSALLHKNSDSLLETSRVLGSVPQETITTTRQVLAAFNYDYSALHRREYSYVSGTGPWASRSAFWT